MKLLNVSMGALILASVLSCSNAQAKYAGLSSKFTHALQAGSQKELLTVSDEITDEMIHQAKGDKLLKLKISALTFAGEYERAFSIVTRYRPEFPDDYELPIAQGLIAEHIGIASKGYFTDAFDELKNGPANDKTDAEKVSEYYLSVLLGTNSSQYVQENLYASLSAEAKQAADHYSHSTRDELFASPPIGFVATRPVAANAGSKREEWWGKKNE